MRRCIPSFFRVSAVYLLLGILLLTTHVAQAMSSPVPLLQNAANRIISMLKQDHTQRSVQTAVNRHLLPLIDEQEIARRVVGVHDWRSATEQQRQAFIREMRTMVIATYSVAFTNYTNERIQFLPLRQAIDQQQHLLVKSWIIKSDHHKIWVNYHLLRRHEQWKIYDFSVDGLSLVESYRAQFAHQLRRSGLVGLTQRLKQHNRQAHEHS